MPGCFAPGCHNHGGFSKNRRLSFFSLPADANRRAEWLERIKRGNPPKHSRLCSDHFVDSDFKQDFRPVVFGAQLPKRHLLPSAVPSILPVDQFKKIRRQGKSAERPVFLYHQDKKLKKQAAKATAPVKAKKKILKSIKIRKADPLKTVTKALAGHSEIEEPIDFQMTNCFEIEDTLVGFPLSNEESFSLARSWEFKSEPTDLHTTNDTEHFSHVSNKEQKEAMVLKEAVSVVSNNQQIEDDSLTDWAANEPGCQRARQGAELPKRPLLPTAVPSIFPANQFKKRTGQCRKSVELLYPQDTKSKKQPKKVSEPVRVKLKPRKGNVKKRKSNRRKTVRGNLSKSVTKLVVSHSEIEEEPFDFKRSNFFEIEETLVDFCLSNSERLSQAHSKKITTEPANLRTTNDEEHFSHVSNKELNKKQNKEAVAVETIDVVNLSVAAVKEEIRGDFATKHFKSISSELVGYLNEGFLCDVTLITHGNCLHAHSVILAAASPRLKAALKSCERRSKLNTYLRYLHMFDIETLKVAVHYMYTGSVLLPSLDCTSGSLLRSNALVDCFTKLGLCTEKLEKRSVVLDIGIAPEQQVPEDHSYHISSVDRLFSHHMDLSAIACPVQTDPIRIRPIGNNQDIIPDGDLTRLYSFNLSPSDNISRHQLLSKENTVQNNNNNNIMSQTCLQTQGSLMLSISQTAPPRIAGLCDGSNERMDSSTGVQPTRDVLVRHKVPVVIGRYKFHLPDKTSLKCTDVPVSLSDPPHTDITVSLSNQAIVKEETSEWQQLKEEGEREVTRGLNEEDEGMEEDKNEDREKEKKMEKEDIEDESQKMFFKQEVEEGEGEDTHGEREEEENTQGKDEELKGKKGKRMPGEGENAQETHEITVKEEVKDEIEETA